MSDKKRRPWTTEEDEILRKRIKSYGLNNWGMVADGLPGRSGKSCSERWRIYLTPGVKRPTQEPFNEYEVAVIYLGQQVHGNQWSAIAKLLPGRTNTAIKNLWKTALQSTEAKRVKSNQYIQAGHTLDTLLANPPSASEMAAVQRRKAAAAAARRRRQEAAAAAAAAASNATSTGTVSGSGADSSGCGSEEDGTAMSGDKCEEGADASGVSAHGTTASEVQDVQEDHMQVDGPAAAVDSAAMPITREQACSPGSAGSESNAPGADAGAATAAAGVGSADRTERCSADGSSKDPRDTLNPMSCGVMHQEDYSMLGDVDFCFDEPDNDSPLDSSCDQLGGSAWDMSEPSDLLLPEGEQEAAAAAAAASISAPGPSAAPGGGSCGEANSNSSARGESPVDEPAAPEVPAAAPMTEQQPNLVPVEAAAATAAPAATVAGAAGPPAQPVAAPAAAVPTPAPPRLGGLKPGTGLRVLLPPGSIEAVQLPKPQQQQQQQQTQVPAATTAAAAASSAAGMVPVVTPQQQQMLMQQQLSAQQQQQLQAQLMLQAWQQQQQLQMQQQQAAKQQSKAASSSRRAQRRRPARAAVKRSDSESDNDAEIDEAAARAAAEAIASGAIKLNPNVHPAAAAAAAADAARAAARAAARKAASAAAANARKKNKAAAGTGSEPERKVARAAAASDADEDDQEGGVSRQGRQTRRAAAGIAKVVAAEADEATHLGLSPVDNPAQDLQDPAAAAAMEVDVMQYGMGVPVSSSGAADAAAAAAAVAGAHSEYTMSYTPVYNSSMGHAGQAAGQMSGAVAGAGAQDWATNQQQAGMVPAAAPVKAGPAAPAGAAGMAPCPVSGENMMQQFSDDPIIMELFKHEMSVAQALQQPPTSPGGPATTPTAAGAASAVAAVSPSFQQGQQAMQPRVSAGSGVVGSPQATPGPLHGSGMAPLVIVGSSAAALPSPAARTSTGAAASGGAVAVVDPAEAAATPRGFESTIPAGSAAVAGSQTMTMGGSEVSAVTAAGGMSAAPMQIQRQLPLAVPGTPAGAACSTADSEGSVFTASSRNSSTITSNLRGTAAGLPSGFVPQGQHATGVGYYVTFTAPNGTRQQVLVQPAGGMATAAPNSSGNFNGAPMQQQQHMMMNMPVMSMPAPTSSMGMPASMGMGMMPIGSSAPAVAPSGGCAMYSQHMGAGQHQAQHQQQHSNPVLAAMLSSNSDMSAHNPVLHATMAALSNQGSCNCVYCLTSGGRQQGMCRPQQGAGCIMGSAADGAAAGANCSGAAGQQVPTPAQLASWAMPPPRPVLLPQHPLAGKQAAAAAAAITAAAVGAGVGVPAGMTADMAGTSTGQGFDSVTMGTHSTMGMGSVTAGMAPQLAVSMSAAAAGKAAEAAAAAAAAAAAVGGLVGSDDEEHDWGFDVVDLDGLDVTF